MSSTIGNPTDGTLRNGQHSVGKAETPATLPFARPKAVKPPRKKKSDRRLGRAQQKKFLEWMIQGASPQVACHKLDVSLPAFWNTLDHDAHFAGELQRVWDTLSFNVVAALYQAAIKGNGPAQQFWLKHRPPPRWAAGTSDTTTGDDLETMSDDELLDRARTEAPDLAAEIAARIAATPGGFPPPGISELADGPGE